MNQFSGGIHHLRVCTYGRFLDIAKNLDKPNEPVQTDIEEDA
jgi:hypothetical protein